LPPPADKADFLRTLVAVARGAGHPPSRSEFVSRTGISEYYITRFFPSWSAAVRAAGLKPHTLNVRLADRALLEDWGRIVRRARKPPARRAYRRLGKHDPRTVERRFGPWSTLPDFFRIFAQDKPEWADVLALLPVPRPAPRPLPDEDHAPIQQSASFVLPDKLRHPPLEDRPTYGNPMDFRGLRHEPVNEQGVVLLFGIVANELGYLVEAVQSGFPDCEAKRQIGPGRWQRIHIEFEFESRNFRDHGHPYTGCDVIVCWRHNWDDCPAHIEVLELSSAIKSLPTSED